MILVIAMVLGVILSSMFLRGAVVIGAGLVKMSGMILLVMLVLGLVLGGL